MQSPPLSYGPSHADRPAGSAGVLSDTWAPVLAGPPHGTPAWCHVAEALLEPARTGLGSELD